jgi:hypothetical protein
MDTLHELQQVFFGDGVSVVSWDDVCALTAHEIAHIFEIIHVFDDGAVFDYMVGKF